MPVMGAAEQETYFRNRLGRVLPPVQVDAFREDLLRANLDYMDAALKRVSAAAQSAGSPPRDARLAVRAEYDRHVAVTARLFPVFFVFESAWRTLTAAVLAAHYRGDDWWHPVRRAVLANSPTSRVTTPTGVRLLPEVAGTVGFVLRGLPPSATAALSTSYELIGHCTLGNVESLVARHWSEFSTVFHAGPIGLPTSSVFLAKFKRVRRARNDAYHHRVVSDRSRAVEAAEQLLDLINVHLASRVGSVEEAATAPFRFNAAKEARHQ